MSPKKKALQNVSPMAAAKSQQTIAFSKKSNNDENESSFNSPKKVSVLKLDPASDKMILGSKKAPFPYFPEDNEGILLLEKGSGESNRTTYLTWVKESNGFHRAYWEVQERREVKEIKVFDAIPVMSLHYFFSDVNVEAQYASRPKNSEVFDEYMCPVVDIRYVSHFFYERNKGNVYPPLPKLLNQQKSNGKPKEQVPVPPPPTTTTRHPPPNAIVAPAPNTKPQPPPLSSSSINISNNNLCDPKILYGKHHSSLAKKIALLFGKGRANRTIDPNSYISSCMKSVTRTKQQIKDRLESDTAQPLLRFTLDKQKMDFSAIYGTEKFVPTPPVDKVAAPTTTTTAVVDKKDATTKVAPPVPEKKVDVKKPAAAAAAAAVVNEEPKSKKKQKDSKKGKKEKKHKREKQKKEEDDEITIKKREEEEQQEKKRIEEEEKEKEEAAKKKEMEKKSKKESSKKRKQDEVLQEEQKQQQQKQSTVKEGKKKKTKVASVIPLPPHHDEEEVMNEDLQKGKGSEEVMIVTPDINSKDWLFLIEQMIQAPPSPKNDAKSILGDKSLTIKQRIESLSESQLNILLVLSAYFFDIKPIGVIEKTRSHGNILGQVYSKTTRARDDESGSFLNTTKMWYTVMKESSPVILRHPLVIVLQISTETTRKSILTSKYCINVTEDLCDILLYLESIGHGLINAKKAMIEKEVNLIDFSTVENGIVTPSLINEDIKKESRFVLQLMRFMFQIDESSLYTRNIFG